MMYTFINIGATEMMLLLAPIIALLVYAIYQCINNPALSSVQRLIWLIIIFSLPFFGSLGYLVKCKGAKHHHS